jgi:hypothetical protein
VFDSRVREAKQIIESYAPRKSTPMGERVDYADQIAMQEQWTKALNLAIAKKRNPQEFVKALATTIRNRYEQRERAVERMSHHHGHGAAVSRG